jgi:hypothetical protein
VDEQHSFDADRASASAFGILITGLYRFTELLPWNDDLHIVNEPLFARFLPIFLEAISQRFLFHRQQQSGEWNGSCIIAQIMN